MIQLHNFNQFLDRLDQQIAEARKRITELEAKRSKAIEGASHAFDKMHEAEELLAAIKDGLTKGERHRIVKILGREAQNASPNELIIMLQAEIQRARKTGLDKTEAAERLAEQIRIEQELLDQLKEIRTAYENAGSPEEQKAIEHKFAYQTAEDRNLKSRTVEQMTKDFEDELEAQPDFNIPGFS